MYVLSALFIRQSA